MLGNNSTCKSHIWAVAVAVETALLGQPANQDSGVIPCAKAPGVWEKLVDDLRWKKGTKLQMSCWFITALECLQPMPWCPPAVSFPPSLLILRRVSGTGFECGACSGPAASPLPPRTCSMYLKWNAFFCEVRKINSEIASHKCWNDYCFNGTVRQKRPIKFYSNPYKCKIKYSVLKDVWVVRITFFFEFINRKIDMWEIKLRIYNKMSDLLIYFWCFSNFRYIKEVLTL